MPTFHLGPDEFVIDDFPRARPFASFLPGIAGLWGIPMWVFYVNRGQAIASFGVQDKEHPIMEFQPANRAYRCVSLHGFRTFIKVSGRAGEQHYEPFRTAIPASGRPRASAVPRMRLRMHELLLEEINPSLGLKVEVRYFTIPHEPFAALARILTVTNLTTARRRLTLIDGLPAIVPYGMLDRFLKSMSRTLEAWVHVEHLADGVPFYRLKVEPHDRPEVIPVKAGHFFASCFTPSGGAKARMLQPIIDPSVVFGHHDDLLHPGPFLAKTFRLPRRQSAADKTPCAMGLAETSLGPRASVTVYELYGHAESAERLESYLPAILDPAFFERKAQANRELIEQLTQPVATASGLPSFDLSCRQNFLDNVLRGGAPVAFANDGKRPSNLHYVYARKHGDLERDYNFFVIPSTPFSQGNANYRDVNQNRRSDVWFYPEVAEQNVVTFFNLLQADGYNPLIFKGLRYTCPDAGWANPALRELLAKPFTPGELLSHLEHRRLKLDMPKEALIRKVMQAARSTEEAEHGEGFWTDHWTYNLDLLESYLGVYPERLRRILLEQRVFTFYDNAHVVAPRAKKLHQAGASLRQVHAVYKDADKTALIQARTEQPHVMRAEHGRGEVYTTTLLVKMVCVIANKLASLDPSATGVEMEADKPNWYDALNGLPWLLGSSACETFELKRWVVFLEGAFGRLRLGPATPLAFPEELAELLDRLGTCLDKPPADYWQASGAAKERYRERTRLGFSGRERTLTLTELLAFLRAARKRLDRAIGQAYDPALKLYRSYFYFEADGPAPADGRVEATRLRRRALPLFLEGMVHALRVETDRSRARALHRAVKASELYDKKLKMYRVCGSLADQPEEIGRCRVFSPGWLENQSIWLHMEYKYLLELLRQGLEEEFFEEFRAALVAFQPAERYGRSVLENCSFLVSSAYHDPSLHGAGFVARLSGATAEFLQMWRWMTAGRQPFGLDERGRLTLMLAPMLAKEYFRKDGRFECRFLGRIPLVYVNAKRRPTFGRGAAKPVAVKLQPSGGSKPILLKSGLIPAPYAEMVRAGKITRIDVTLS